MPPISLIELNRSLFHSHHGKKEEEDRTHINSNININRNSSHSANDSWLSCALASHGNFNAKTSTSTSASKASHPVQVKEGGVRKQTIASTGSSSMEGQLLESMVSTLTAKLRTQDAELTLTQQFPEKHDRYVELFLALESIKDQLECAVHENTKLKRQAKGLEAALVLQDIELDAADKTTMQNHTNENTNANTDANADSKKQEGNAQEHVDQLDQLERERDTAVKQATQLAIQLAESQASVDDLRDKMIECKAVKIYYQQNIPNNNTNNHNNGAELKVVDEPASTSNIRSFFWPRGGAMFSGTSTPQVKGGSGASAEYDDENDDTENLSVSSISEDSIGRLQQVDLEQQQDQQLPEPQPSENGSTLEGLDYAPSASEEHNYV